MGFILLVQLILFPLDNSLALDQEVYVEIIAPKYANIAYDLEAIDKLYLSNSLNYSNVDAISVEGDTFIVRLVDKGFFDSNAFIFAGRKVSLNERIRIHGLIEAEGVVTDLGEVRW